MPALTQVPVKMLAGQRHDISIAVPGTSVSEGKDQASTDSRANEQCWLFSNMLVCSCGEI